MTTGEGVFTSTLLLIISFFIWQITLNKKWRTVGKWFAIVGLSSLLLGIGAWRLFKFSTRFESSIVEAPTRQTELGGIELGLTSLDVQLKRGKPDQVLDTEKDGDSTISWQYSSRFTDDAQLTVTFDKKGDPNGELQVAIVCEKGSKYSFLGIDQFSNEETIRRKLGAPTETSIREDGLAKLISYKDWNAAFGLEQDLLQLICISSNGKVRFSKEYQQK